MTDAREVISRRLSGIRFAMVQQEDEAVRLVSDLEASQVVDGLSEAAPCDYTVIRKGGLGVHLRRTRAVSPHQPRGRGRNQWRVSR